MKRISIFSGLLSFLLMTSGVAEAPNSNQQVLVLAREVRAQQLTIAENQAKMDAKLATIAEDLRMARILAGRGGGR